MRKKESINTEQILYQKKIKIIKEKKFNRNSYRRDIKRLTNIIPLLE